VPGIAAVVTVPARGIPVGGDHCAASVAPAMAWIGLGWAAGICANFIWLGNGSPIAARTVG